MFSSKQPGKWETRSVRSSFFSIPVFQRWLYGHGASLSFGDHVRCFAGRAATHSAFSSGGGVGVESACSGFTGMGTGSCRNSGSWNTKNS